MARAVICVLVVAALVSCGRGGSVGSGVAGDSIKFGYARLVHVYRHDGWIRAVVDNPWKSGAVLHAYNIVPKNGKVPASLPEGTLLRTPLERTVVFMSAHCTLLSALRKLQAVKGVCDARYILKPEVVGFVARGGAEDMGMSMQPNVEKIVAAKPDALLVSPFANGGGYGKLETAGLALLECADYMERSPLARAEWMRFYGLLYGCPDKADSLFAAVESSYNALKESAALSAARPKLMCDLMQSGNWFVPGGESTIGQMFKDAGACYLFGGNKASGSVNLAKEKVLAEAADADVWIVRYGNENRLSYESLRRENQLYAKFKPWKQRRIYACNTLKVPYFDEEPFRPDYMLRDLVAILHPELAPKGGMRYFEPLKDNQEN